MAKVIFRRGDFVVAAAPGSYGKPRPALVVQSDLFSALPSVTLCPITSMIRNDADLLRITVEPSETSGLKEFCQIIIDKITTLPIEKVGKVIGRADDALMIRVNRALATFLEIA